MPNATVAWPHCHEFLKLSGYILMWHLLLNSIFSLIDGLNLPRQVSSDVEMKNAMCNSWLHSHFISSVIVFSSKGKCPLKIHLGNSHNSHTGEIIACYVNCPGSWHDSCVAAGIYRKLKNKTPNGFCFVADLVFPQGNDQVMGKIHVPLKAGQPLLLDFGE